MFLKTLTLKGFKSFAEKSVLNLEPGITAVVGPNGSGKSNISDAVLWVLGERNAKNLRGQTMEDVIFAGSMGKRATGFAEVELVLDNSDSTLPIEYSDVVITRRMYRSGESEYYINGSLARRLDVLDILHDSGLGTGTHSIISQGSLDSVLQSKPEDRRSLIEEAAGVLKHKQKMVKSDRKIEKIDQNLDRVRDVIKEIDRQLAPLERKAKKAKTYFELKERNDEIRLQLAVDDLRNLQKRWDAQIIEESTQQEITAKHKENIESIDREIEAIQEQIKIDNKDSDAFADKMRKVSLLSERIDSQITVIRDRRRIATNRNAELLINLERFNRQNTSNMKEFLIAKDSFSALDTQKRRAEENVRNLSDDLSTKSTALKEKEDELARIVEEQSKIENGLSANRMRLTQYKESLSNNLAHIELIEQHASELAIQKNRASEDYEEARSEHIELKKAYDAIEAQVSASKDLLRSCTTAYEASKKAHDDAVSSEQSTIIQIKALEDIEIRRVNDNSAANQWISSRSSKEAGYELFSRIAKVDKEYESLVEALLGSEMDSYVLDDLNELRAISKEYESAGISGELFFTFLDRNSNDRRESDIPISKNGFSHFHLTDVVECDPKHDEAVEELIGDVIVCKDIDDALDAYEQMPNSFRYVGLDGTVVYPSGKTTIGLSLKDDSETGIFARLRHIDDLRSELEKTRSLLVETRERVKDAEDSLREAQQSSLSLSEQLARLKGEVASSLNISEMAKGKLDSIENELSKLDEQKEFSRKEAEIARPEIESLQKEIEGSERVYEDLKLKSKMLSVEIEQIRKEVETSSKDHSEAKLEFLRLSERVDYSKRMIDRHMNEMDNNKSQITDTKEKIISNLISQKRLIPLLQAYDLLLSNVKKIQTEIESESSAYKSNSLQKLEHLDNMRVKLQRSREEYDAQNEKLSNMRVEKAKLEMQVSSAVEVIVDDCGAVLDSALKLPEIDNREELEQETFKLSRRISNLGTINPEAAEDYDEIKTRFDYLSKQLNDLENASRSLLKINNIIERRIREDFIATFDIVNQNFQEVFATLFPGGNAFLSFEDPEDIENTGIEVTAQPAGKRIAKMSLMSGGEKSLTALALLFALYKTRATPFYILDEVEAALDDTNLKRLITFIEAMRRTTQLIMITHQRRTMEAADVLFGVSMQSDGVTKVISQKLENALKQAE